MKKNTLSEKQKIFDIRVSSTHDAVSKYIMLISPILSLTHRETEVMIAVAWNKGLNSKNRMKIFHELGFRTQGALSLILKQLTDRKALKNIGRGKYVINPVFLPEDLQRTDSITFRFVWQTSSIPT